MLAHERDVTLSEQPQPLSAMTPHIRDILIENVLATNVLSSAAFIVGLPEAPIDNVTSETLAMRWRLEERAGDPEYGTHGRTFSRRRSRY